MPCIPTTYTFLSFGSSSTEDMYTADAYAEPKISSYSSTARGDECANRRHAPEGLLTTCASMPSLSNLVLYIRRDCVALFVTNMTALSAAVQCV